MCFVKDLCLGPFFDSIKSCDKLLLFFDFLCVRLPSLFCTCVSGFESNFSVASRACWKVREVVKRVASRACWKVREEVKSVAARAC